MFFSTVEIVVLRLTLSIPVQVIKINKHEAYNPDTFSHDVATMQLSNSVDFSDTVQIVRMASGSNDYTDYIGTVSGWGTTSEGKQEPH